MNPRREARVAFQLQIGAMSVGVLMAHCRTPGPSAHGQLADAITLLLFHRAPREPATTAPEWSRPRPGWAQPPAHRAQVHQATGMVSVQLGVTLAEAVVRLRAYAHAEGQLVAQVAADVVACRLRF